MRIIRIVLYSVLIIIGISFSVLNSSSVPVDFYFIKFNWPVALFMLFALGIGMIVGVMLVFSSFWRIKLDNRRMKKQLQFMEQELKKHSNFV